MAIIRVTERYKRDYRRIKHGLFPRDSIDNVVVQLANGELPSEDFETQSLGGNYWSCQVELFCVLVYKKHGDELPLVLIQTGPYTDQNLTALRAIISLSCESERS